MNHYGYYMFLGLGDFGMPEQVGPEWTSTWNLAKWREKVDELVVLGTNTLFLYLIGHKLPYPSGQFPDCVEQDHPNVKDDFLQALIDLCRERDIEVVAVFTTTGHAAGYTSLHPQAATQDRDGSLRVEQGILCHHNQEGIAYPLGAITECLERYHGFSGVILHPPEFSVPCFCGECRRLYEESRGKDLLSVPEEEARGFFMSTNLAFQKTVLEPEIRQRVPGCRFLTFTIPWVFETHFEQLAEHIAPETTIVDWDYRLSDEDRARVPGRLKRLMQFGHQVWFMPTCGFAFDREKSSDEQADAVLAQIRAALAAGIEDVVYFMGPVWWPTVERTSLTG